MPSSRNIKETIVTGKEKSLMCLKRSVTRSDLHFQMVTGDILENENELRCGSMGPGWKATGSNTQQASSPCILGFP